MEGFSAYAFSKMAATRVIHHHTREAEISERRYFQFLYFVSVKLSGRFKRSVLLVVTLMFVTANLSVSSRKDGILCVVKVSREPQLCRPHPLSTQFVCYW